jgi:hypothetical protein
MCNVVYSEKRILGDIVGAPVILEQKEIVRFRWSQLLVLFLVFVQPLNGTTS